MSKAEKITILGSLASSALLAGYFMLKPQIADRKVVGGETLQEKRGRILKDGRVRVLYSTMSFFYLQKYESNAQSLMFLKEILDIAKPKFVALQLS
jgi:hypothetical protein